MNPRRYLIGVVIAALACAAASPALARDERFGRLDPEERMRLRGAIQRHAWEDRQRAREAWRHGHAGPPPGGYAYPPYPPPGYGSAPPPGYGGAPPAGQPGGAGYGFAPQPGLPRLSPEERQALRRQLRDARRFANDDPNGNR